MARCVAGHRTVNSNSGGKERVLQENNCLQRFSLCASISITELWDYCSKSLRVVVTQKKKREKDADRN